MDLPEDVVILAGIKQGSVYYFAEDTHSTSTDPHYFVLLNLNPTSDTELILINCSSRIEKVRRRTKYCPETIVEVRKEEYPEFTEPISAFDGNSITPQTIGNLVRKVKDGKLKRKPDMPSHIVEKLIRAVLSSKTVENRFKKIIRPDNVEP